MGTKKKPYSPGPIPPGNQPHAGPPQTENPSGGQESGGGAPFTEQDPKRRLGNFEGAGEAPYRQPGGLNDADH